MISFTQLFNLYRHHTSGSDQDEFTCMPISCKQGRALLLTVVLLLMFQLMLLLLLQAILLPLPLPLPLLPPPLT